MTKEEIRKEATAFVRAYITGAEPREKRIAELEKENAELKEQLGDKVMQKQKDKADLVWKLKTANEQKASQLTKAKELIKEMLSILPKENIEGIYEITEEAEQFINEVEK